MRLRDAALTTLVVVAALAASVPAGATAAPGLRGSGPLARRGHARPSANDRGDFRVVGGIPTTSSQFPWQVQLEIETEEGGFLCGGTLVHPYVVLTAAHCLTDESGEFSPGIEVTAWLGRTQLFSGGIPDEAFDLWVPTAYRPETTEYDYAFVSLFEASSLPRLQIAGPTERALWAPGRIQAITGWGTTSEEGSLSPVLREGRVPIVADGTCALPGVNGEFGFSATTMVCAGFLGGGADTCQGDSGGPLQAPIDGGGYRLVGITSWGIGCAEPNRPGVYTRVAADPIESKIAAAIPVIESEDEIPATGVSVIGAGARPPGCALAEQQVAAAAATVGAANGTILAGEGKLRTAKSSKTAATSAVRAALRSKRRGLPGAGPRVRAAKKKLKSAGRELKARRGALGTARSGAATAGAALASAGANRSTVCG